MKYSFTIRDSAMRICFLFITALIITGCKKTIKSHAPLQSPIETIWKSDSIIDGVVWSSQQFKSLFNSSQNINIIDIDLNKKNVEIDIAFSDSLTFLTSTYGILSRGIAAINGTFFDERNGGALEHLKVDNEVINEVYEEMFQSYKGDAALTIDTLGRVDITTKKDSRYYGIMYRDVIAGGPHLIHNGRINDFFEDDFCSKRNPRTSVGITNTNHLLFIVVDGRSNQSEGFTILELATFMKEIGCIQALNLDGGGSSTMWIKDQPFNGVVNNPSDNKKFDHQGQRPVANAIIIRAK